MTLRASAPGKLVLSGAYSILWGAPAIVTAVSRRAWADIRLPQTFVSAEIEAARALLLEEVKAVPAAPGIDATELRTGSGQHSRKLGLGSSSAILSAALTVLLAQLNLPSDPDSVFRRALLAHRRAQGGGSGLDILASCCGGTRSCALLDGELTSKPVQLPPGLILEVWAMPESATTSHFVKAVRACETASREEFLSTMGAQRRASEEAAVAFETGATRRFIEALREQCQALTRLGEIAEVPIVVPAVRSLAASLASSAAFLPSGAGGGDITLYAALEPSPEPFRAAATRAGLNLIELDCGAPGAQLHPEP